MKLSKLVEILNSELKNGDGEVFVAIRPGWGLIMPGQPTGMKREGSSTVLIADEVDLDYVNWIAKYDGHNSEEQ